MGMTVRNDTKRLVRINLPNHAINLELKTGDCKCNLSDEYIKKISPYIEAFGLTLENDTTVKQPKKNKPEPKPEPLPEPEVMPEPEPEPEVQKKVVAAKRSFRRRVKRDR